MTFLQRYHDDVDEFLDRIITGNETWVAHITPETKQLSMHWRHTGSPCKTKFKQTLSARKLMCTLFWDIVVPILGNKLLRHRDERSWSHGMTNVSVPEVNVLKNSSKHAVYVPINLSVKLGFVSVNGSRETHFVDALRRPY